MKLGSWLAVAGLGLALATFGLVSQGLLGGWATSTAALSLVAALAGIGVSVASIVASQRSGGGRSVTASAGDVAGRFGGVARVAGAGGFLSGATMHAGLGSTAVALVSLGVLTSAVVSATHSAGAQAALVAEGGTPISIIGPREVPAGEAPLAITGDDGDGSAANPFYPTAGLTLRQAGWEFVIGGFAPGGPFEHDLVITVTRTSADAGDSAEIVVGGAGTMGLLPSEFRSGQSADVGLSVPVDDAIFTVQIAGGQPVYFKIG
jgi:hypothetical protein